MPPTHVVLHRDVEGFQNQYGTLWQAVDTYLSGHMPAVQAAALERVVDPAFINAVAQSRVAKAIATALSAAAQN